MLAADTLHDFLEGHYGGLLVRDADNPVGVRQWSDDDTSELCRWLTDTGYWRELACFDAKTTAAHIGVDAATVRQWLRRDQNPLPHFKHGKRMLIPVYLVKDWLREETERRCA